MKLARITHVLAGQGHRKLIISRVRGYHGTAYGGTSAQGIAPNRQDFGPFVDDVVQVPADDVEALASLMAERGNEVAAVIVEPVAGSTGCLPPPKGYLEKLRAITEKHGILLIFDEVITGFGRLGYGFAAERYGIQPDMITFAKGVTNAAVPMSGVLVRKGVYEAHMTGPDYLVELFHGFTYSGHPLAAAAGVATLDIYRDEGLFERARKLEPVFAEAMMSLKSAPNVADIRPVGLMCGIDLDPLPGKPGARGYDAIERMYWDHDLHCRVTMDTLIIAPPLISTEAQISEIRDRILAVLKSVA
jgi:beta-alanine--pyruvate transaminase